MSKYYNVILEQVELQDGVVYFVPVITRDFHAEEAGPDADNVSWGQAKKQVRKFYLEKAASMRQIRAGDKVIV